MHNYKRFKMNIVAMLIFIFFIISILMINWNRYERLLMENEQERDVQTQIVTQGQIMRETSNQMINLVRNYILNNDITYFRQYWDIYFENRGREFCLDQIEQFELSEDEQAKIQELRKYCEKMEELEVLAMQQALREQEVDENTYEDAILRKYILYTKEYATEQYDLNQEQYTAIQFVMGEDYEKYRVELFVKLDELLNVNREKLLEDTTVSEKLSKQAVWGQFLCIILVLLCLVLLFWQNRKVYTLRNMNEIIASAVTEEYLNFGLVNLNTNTVVKLQRVDGEIKSLESGQNFIEMMEDYMFERVSTPYQESFIRTVQPGNIMNKLGQEQVVSCVYKSQDDRWLMLDFAKSREYTDLNPVVIYTFKNAGELVEQQKEQRQRDEMLMYFSKDFFEVYVVDLNKGSYEIIRSAERYGNYIKNLTGDFTQLMQMAIVSWTTPPYRGMFKQLMDMQDIKTRFVGGAKKIEFIYKSYDEKWKNLQCFPVPDYGIGNERMIFALRDYSEEMQIRTNEVLATEAMNNIYSLVVFRDMEANKYECIHVSEDLQYFQEKGSYEAFLEEMINNIHAEDQEKYERDLSDEKFDRDGRAECEFRMKDYSGEYHYYHEYITKVEVPSGTRMAILIKNIDESKMHEIWEAERLQKELETKAKELEMAKLLAEKSKDLEKALKQAESANDAKSRFLSNMSHDLRTPMNAILGMTYLAKKHINDEEQMKKCLNTILSSSENMVALINDVLDMNKIESGVIELHEKPASLDKLISDMQLFFQNKCESNHQDFIINFENVEHKSFIMDELRVKQILTNLVSNAVKYTQSFGRISLDITEKSCDEEGICRICFVITDNGIGMSEEFVAKVFEPFEREETALSAKIEGTGLGMAIVKNFVDVMHGEIAIDSMVNVGTKVTVILPLKVCDNVEPVYEKDFSTVQHKYPGKHILIVEDKRINLEIVKGFLEDTELIIDEARNGKEAVEKFTESAVGTYDLIFMDIRMPVMKGDEATSLIRGLEREDSKQIPIIAMTANALESDVENSYRCGMSGHISKPIEPDAVYRCLNKWLLGEEKED